MIIKCDLEGKQIIEQLVDVSLKTGGIKNLNAALEILKKIEIIEQEEVKEEVKN
jgi:hypothetical protein